MTSLQALTNYTNIARAYYIFYLTPCLPLLTPAIYSLAFIILCYLLRRTLLYSHHPPTKPLPASPVKQAHQMVAPQDVQSARAYSSTQYRQRQPQESEEGNEDCTLLIRLFACCTSRPSECEVVPAT